MRVGVVGGGIFGVLTCIEILQQNSKSKVVLFEADNDLFRRSTSNNQARIHSGLHYPRSMETAMEANDSYKKFLNKYSTASFELVQYYGIASIGSKTTPEQFSLVAEELKIDFQIVSTTKFTRPGFLELLMKTKEATYDFNQVLKSSLTELGEYGDRFTLSLNSEVRKIIELADHVEITINNREEKFDSCVVASYAMNHRFANALGITYPDTTLQLCEVALGYLPQLRNTGITIMDGPYWSLMPHGFSGLHSLTNVAFTPNLLENASRGKFKCQELDGNCGEYSLKNCNGCVYRPKSNTAQILRRLSLDSDKRFELDYQKSIFTVKAIPSNFDESTSARPTESPSSSNKKIHFVFSGKIASAPSFAEKIGKVLSSSS